MGIVKALFYITVAEFPRPLLIFANECTDRRTRMGENMKRKQD